MRTALTSRTATRITFGVIVAFVLAQVAWWLIFQQSYLSKVTTDTQGAWQQDLRAANAALEHSPGDKALARQLLAEYPQLRLDAGNHFVLNNTYGEAFLERQHGYVLMFAFEIPFFMLVVLSGLWIIARSLRTERELKRRQQNFLDAVSHEFKTPLSTLRLLIETAQLRRLDTAKQQDYLRRMAAELERLEHLSQQVLANERLEQQGEPLGLEPLELRGVVRGIVEAARMRLEARGAKLELELGSEPLPVLLDPESFRVVLNNLLDNAVKYSLGTLKPVTVKVESSGAHALVHVEDRGIGVPKDERRHIFDRFYRAGSELTRTSPGVGLGLYLVKSAAEAMGGWVEVEANGEQGACFTIALPRRVLSKEVV
jgi:signal transduction histidine kinase